MQKGSNNLLQSSSVRKMLRFAIVGSVNTAADLVVYNALLLTLMLMFRFDIAIALSKTVGFVFASIVSYELNARWTFMGRTRTVKNYGVFLALSVIGMLINVCCTVLIANVLTAMHIDNGILVANAAFLAATSISLVWNYESYRRLVFRA